MAYGTIVLVWGFQMPNIYIFTCDLLLNWAETNLVIAVLILYTGRQFAYTFKIDLLQVTPRNVYSQRIVKNDSYVPVGFCTGMLNHMLKCF